MSTPTLGSCLKIISRQDSGTSSNKKQVIIIIISYIWSTIKPTSKRKTTINKEKEIS